MSHLPDWPRAHGSVSAQARYRATPEDFRVDEILGFEADGEGEHVLLAVEKRGANTHWVAKELARFAGVSPREVSYAGMKDRRAVATQHFTIHLNRRTEPDWSACRNDEFHVTAAARHRRKLRIGALRGNRFRIVLRELSQPASTLLPKLEAIRRSGVPNYYGMQRFGRDGSNMARAESFLSGQTPVRDRRLRGLLLSAARSTLFNAILARRVASGDWNRPLPGDVLMLDGRHSIFPVTEIDDVLRNRVDSGELHPTGALWGRGDTMATGPVRDLEAVVAGEHPVLSTGLEAQGLEPARRALRLRVPDLAWSEPDPTTLILEFFLPAGAYATTVLRELANTNEEGETSDAHED